MLSHYCIPHNLLSNFCTSKRLNLRIALHSHIVPRMSQLMGLDIYYHNSLDRSDKHSDHQSYKFCKPHCILHKYSIVIIGQIKMLHYNPVYIDHFIDLVLNFYLYIWDKTKVSDHKFCISWHILQADYWHKFHFKHLNLYYQLDNLSRSCHLKNRSHHDISCID